MVIIRGQVWTIAGAFYATLLRFQLVSARRNFWLAVQFLAGLLELLVWLGLGSQKLQLRLELN